MTLTAQRRPSDSPLHGVTTEWVNNHARYKRQCVRCGRRWEIHPSRPDTRRGMCVDCHDVDPTFGITQEEHMQLIEALNEAERQLTPGAEMCKALIDTDKAAYAFLATTGEASVAREHARAYLASIDRADLRPSVFAVSTADSNGVRRYNLTLKPKPQEAAA